MEVTLKNNGCFGRGVGIFGGDMYGCVRISAFYFKEAEAVFPQLETRLRI